MGALDVDLMLDIDDFLNWVERNAAGQLAFATSLAMNLAGRESVKDLQRRLPGPFTIRNRYTERSIRMSASTKRNLVTTVGSVQPYMRLQATGGDRRATKDAGTRVAVPHGARPTRQAKTTLAKMPSRIVAKGGWIGPLRYPGSPAVWKIKGGKKRKRQKMVMMYSLHNKVRVGKAWDFLVQLTRALEREWGGAAMQSLERVLKGKEKTVGRHLTSLLGQRARVLGRAPR